MTSATKTKKAPRPNAVSTTNACKCCMPMGATFVFKGIEGAVPFLHGSQGCATYMRRYIISHFREPMDIASSSLGEKHAVYGGGPNLKKGLLNVMQKYEAKLIGVASTCLTETIGDDVGHLLKEFKKEFADLELADVVHVSTPSFQGTHMEGFTAAVHAVVAQLTETKEDGAAADPKRMALFPGFLSTADLRHLREIIEDFGLQPTILPDYAETLDGPALTDYEKLPSGGTPIPAIRSLARVAGAIECGRCLDEKTGGNVLREKHGVPLHATGLPMGLRETDLFFGALEAISGTATPKRYLAERGRYLDSLVDGHKYVSGKTAIVYGEEDLAVGLTSFLSEIGVRPVLVASGGHSGKLTQAVATVTDGLLTDCPDTREDVDFFEIAEVARALEPDLIIGHSKGYRLARELNIPLIRAGFPIHDRFGGHRTLHVGYAGAQALFDRVVNAVIEKKQADNHLGYGYI